MTENASISGNQASIDLSRQLGTEEFIGRLADDLRQTSDSDLPRSFFIEQVKLQLAGQQTGINMNEERNKPSAADRYQSSDCFKAWAIPE